MISLLCTPEDMRRGDARAPAGSPLAAPERSRRPSPARLAAAAALAASLILVPAAGAAGQAPPGGHRTAHPIRRFARVRGVCGPPARGHAACTALLRITVPSSSAAALGASSYTVGAGARSYGPAGGLTPADLASAYNYESAAGGGSGETVGIVDAYDDPAIEEDLAAFDSHYGLPACTTANGCFEKVGQGGSSASLPRADTTRWSVEISLDVDIVHSVCANCKILLVEANEPSYKDLAEAVDTAASMGANEISNSYAGPETGMKSTERAAYNHPGVVIAAATGDDGYYDWDFVNEGREAVGMPNVPASLPTVVAVGGTTLELNENGTRAREAVWNNNGAGDKLGHSRKVAEGATGGGCSTLFTAPLWQQSVPGFAATGCGTSRLAADVAAVADPDSGGFDIYDTYNCGAQCEAWGIGSGSGWLTLGGTSLATPLISSLYGLAGGGGGVPYPALTLYGHLAEPGSLYDVTEGANGFCGGEPASQCGDPDARYGRVDCQGTTACNAAVGFDGPSGVGTPDGLSAFEPVFPAAVITAPGSVKAGVAAGFSASGSSDPFPGGTIATYSWTWGDGSGGSSEASPTHVFAAAGTYQVTLTVTDNYGLTSVPAVRSVDVSGSTKLEEEEAAARRKDKKEEAVGRKQKLKRVLGRLEQQLTELEGGG